MSDNLLNLIKIWNDEAIRNQEQLKLENHLFEFPQWNKGYLACLEDLKAIIKENDDVMVRGESRQASEFVDDED